MLALCHSLQPSMTFLPFFSRWVFAWSLSCCSYWCQLQYPRSWCCHQEEQLCCECFSLNGSTSGVGEILGWPLLSFWAMLPVISPEKYLSLGPALVVTCKGRGSRSIFHNAVPFPDQAGVKCLSRGAAQAGNMKSGRCAELEGTTSTCSLFRLVPVWACYRAGREQIISPA